LKAGGRGVKIIELVVRGSKASEASPVVATWGDAQLVRAGAGNR
jgi:hypothetical protein